MVLSSALPLAWRTLSLGQHNPSAGTPYFNVLISRACGFLAIFRQRIEGLLMG